MKNQDAEEEKANIKYKQHTSKVDMQERADISNRWETTLRSAAVSSVIGKGGCSPCLETPLRTYRKKKIPTHIKMQKYKIVLFDFQ